MTARRETWPVGLLAKHMSVSVNEIREALAIMGVKTWGSLTFLGDEEIQPVADEAWRVHLERLREARRLHAAS